jgi:hypothetical protein
MGGQLYICECLAEKDNEDEFYYGSDSYNRSKEILMQNLRDVIYPGQQNPYTKVAYQPLVIPGKRKKNKNPKMLVKKKSMKP